MSNGAGIGQLCEYTSLTKLMFLRQIPFFNGVKSKKCIRMGIIIFKFFISRGIFVEYTVTNYVYGSADAAS